MVNRFEDLEIYKRSASGRFHFKENKQFCYYSRGSLHETKARVSKCIRRKLIPEPEGLKMQNELDEIGRMLNAYIKSIGG